MGQKTEIEDNEIMENDIENLYNNGGYNSSTDIETSNWWKEKAIKFNFKSIELHQNSQGELKKKLIGMPKEWEKIKLSQDYIKGNCRGVICNKDRGLMCIDFDCRDDYERYYNKFEWIRNQPTEETKNGYHLYCEFDDRLPQKNYKNLKGEILNNNFAICSPTIYRYKENEYAYKWVNGSKKHSLNKIPQEIINYIKKDGEGVWSRKKTPKNKIKVIDEVDIQEKPKINEELYKIIQLIVKQNFKESYHYNDWFKIICSLYTIGNLIDKLDIFKELAHKISLASTKYDKDITNFKFMEGSKLNYTQGTIRHYAKEADSEEYSKIIRNTIKLDHKAIFEEIELRDYFLGMRGGDVLTFHNSKNFFIWKEDESKWREDEGNKLKDIIVDTIDELHTENLKQFSKQLLNATAIYTALSKKEGIDELDLEKAEKVLHKSKELHKQMIKTKACFGKSKLNNVFALISYRLATMAYEVNFFDNRPEIFAFKNKCYNLETNKFFKAQKTDYILSNCDKDYIDPTNEEYDYIDNQFKKIFVDPEKRKCCLSILYTGLSGIRQEKFIVFNGCGRNGKSVINSYMEYLLGSKYFYRPPISSITKQKEGDSNQGLRGMHKMRYLVYSEPEEKSKNGLNQTSLKINLIKDITGNDSINARGIYEKDSDTRMNGTITMECNKKPELKGDADHAIKERIVILEFESIFRDIKDPNEKEEIENNPKYNFESDSKIKSDLYKLKYYSAFFKYIITNKPSGLNLYLPKCTRDAGMEYLQNEDEFSNWFQSIYEKTNIIKKIGIYNDFIPIKQIYKKWEVHLDQCSKNIKRSKNEKFFKGELEKNILTQKYFRKTKEGGLVSIWKKINNTWTIEKKKENSSCGIIGWKPIIEKNNSEDDEEDDEDKFIESDNDNPLDNGI